MSDNSNEVKVKIVTEENNKKKGSKVLNITISLIIVVLSMIFLFERLVQQEHMIDVFLAILVFGIGLIYMYSVINN